MPEIINEEVAALRRSWIGDDVQVLAAGEALPEVDVDDDDDDDDDDEGDVTAAAEVHTGAMIALVPTEEDAARLAVDGGEDADQLHVTLGYLGEAALLPEELKNALVECVARCVEGQPTVVGDAFAVAAFNPDTGMTAAFDPNQKRDARGRWTRVGGTDADDQPEFDPRQLALHYYTGAGFRKLNQALLSDGDLSQVPDRYVFIQRDGKFVDVKVTAADAVKNLDAAIADSPLTEARTFYRGTRRPPPPVGTVNRYENYLSTSRDEKQASVFIAGEGTLWEIHAPVGAHALDVNEGPNVHERETIFPRESAVRVRELVRDDSGRVVRVIADLVEDELTDLVAGGREPCVVLLVAGQQLPYLHDYIMSDVAQTFGALGMELHPQHKPWVAHITLAYTDAADLSYFTDRVGPVTFDRVRLAFGGDVYDIPLGEGRIGEGVGQSGDDDDDDDEDSVIEFSEDGQPTVPNVLWDWRAAMQREQDVNLPGGTGHNLRNYWVRGPGAAKIGWGTDGSFARCVAQLGKYVKNPQGLCAEYHKAATGEWPAEKGVPSEGDTEMFTAEMLYTTDGAEKGAGEVSAVVAAGEKTTKAPYGTETTYADPGYQEDGVKRYPLDTETHIRAAWSYISMPKNAAKYSPEDLKKVKAKIRRAMERIGAEVADENGDSTASGVDVRESWRIERRNGTFAVVADLTDSLVDSFPDRVSAVALLRQLHMLNIGEKDDCPPKHHKMPDGTCMPDSEMAAETVTAAARAEAPAVDEPVVEVNADGRTAEWRGVLTVEGIESGDGRMFAGNGLTWDEPPLPLMWQKETSHGGNTDKSVRVGSIQKIYREPDPGGRADVFLIRGEGTLDLDNPDGAEVFRRMDNGDMRGNSVDVDSIKGADVELVFPEVSTEDGVALGQAFAQPELTIYNRGRIRATTMVEIPAFTEARLELVETDTVTAATSVIEIADAPPREWFDEPTDVPMSGALTVTAEGRIYGYVAPTGVRHRSFAQRSQYVPLGNVDYSRFHGGETIVADGGRVSTGAITMDCGHATTAIKLTGQQASEHYDNTCSLVATARVGENEHGVWIAGALLPDVDAGVVRRVMASRLSGDWRTHLDKPGWREFVAALLVPVPGFPMARSAPSVEVEEGQLVAASVPVVFETSGRAERVAELRVRAGRDTESRRAAALGRVRASRVAALTARVSTFHGTHNQKSHGNRDGDVVPSSDANLPRALMNDRYEVGNVSEAQEIWSYVEGATKSELDELSAERKNQLRSLVRSTEIMDSARANRALAKL